MRNGIALKKGIKLCKHCNRSFKSRSNRQLFCSDKCRNEFKRVKNPKEIEPRNCEYCGEMYIPKSNNQLYCSSGCKEQVNINNKLTKRLKRKNAVHDYCFNKNNDLEDPQRSYEAILYGNKLGSKGTSTLNSPIKNKDGSINFNKERIAIKKEKKLLGL